MDGVLGPVLIAVFITSIHLRLFVQIGDNP
jgi:hypothetical protein